MGGATVLLIGGTGAMGVPVVRHLLSNTSYDWVPRVLTRDPDSTQARALSSLDQRVELVRGDVTDTETVAAAMAGVRAVFCNTDYWSLWNASGESIETPVGIELLDMACRAGVDHFVYSSAEYSSELSGERYCALHFDAKARVESHIHARRQAGDHWYLNHTSVLRTAPYMDNFQTYFLPYQDEEGKLVFSLPIGNAPWCMVALEDIGWFAAQMLSNPRKWKGRDLAVASDVLTLAEIAKTFSDVTGIPAASYAIPDSEFLGLGLDGADDLLNMFQFIREIGLERDLGYLRELHPGLLDFRSWLKKTAWRGEPRYVQKSLDGQ